VPIQYPDSRPSVLHRTVHGHPAAVLLPACLSTPRAALASATAAMAVAAARRLFSFHLHARPLASGVAVATPHRRGKHDAISCKATGKTKPKPKSKAKAGKGGERQQRRALEAGADLQSRPLGPRP
jgi:hypothetical protein